MPRMSHYLKGEVESSSDAVWKTLWGGEREETEDGKGDKREQRSKMTEMNSVIQTWAGISGEVTHLHKNLSQQLGKVLFAD